MYWPLPISTSTLKCLLIPNVSLQYNLPFYLQYLANWPEYCLTAEGPGQEVMGYILGKAEGEGEKWHGHVTAVTVAPEYRCVQRLAQTSWPVCHLRYTV